jgi:hypothetical protein
MGVTLSTINLQIANRSHGQVKNDEAAEALRIIEELVRAIKNHFFEDSWYEALLLLQYFLPGDIFLARTPNSLAY